MTEKFAVHIVSRDMENAAGNRALEAAQQAVWDHIIAIQSPMARGEFMASMIRAMAYTVATFAVCMTGDTEANCTNILREVTADISRSAFSSIAAGKRGTVQ